MVIQAIYHIQCRIMHKMQNRVDRRNELGQAVSTAVAVVENVMKKSLLVLAASDGVISASGAC